MNFGNVNYSPEVAGILGNALAPILPATTMYDPRKVAIGYALMAAERTSLSDAATERLWDAMEAQFNNMVDSDAVEVYERYEAYRQAERDELERMEAQEEYNYELKQAIEGNESYASLEAS